MTQTLIGYAITYGELAFANGKHEFCTARTYADL